MINYDGYIKVVPITRSVDTTLEEFFICNKNYKKFLTDHGFLLVYDMDIMNNIILLCINEEWGNTWFYYTPKLFLLSDVIGYKIKQEKIEV